MKVLVVFDHPRRHSFCGAVLDELIAGLAEAGHEVEIADLHAQGDPRMAEADEPDWNDPDKRYSAAVLAEQARIARNEVLAFVFPVWWWSLPAMLKGWIDRVWNNGWAVEDYQRRGYDEAMVTQLVTGIMNYCGIPEAELRLLYDVTDAAGAERRQVQLREVRALGRSLAVQPA